MAIRSVVAPALQPEPTNRLENLQCVMSTFAKYLEMSMMREQPVQHSSEVNVLESKGRGFVDVQFKLSFLDVEVDDCQPCLVTWWA